MREIQAHEVLLVRAFEESDPEGRLLPESKRAEAAAQARAPSPTDDGSTQPTYVIQRAEILVRELDSRLPPLGTLRPSATRRRGVGFIFLFVVLLAGLSTNALGPEKKISILAFPLLGLLLWNLGFYVLLASGGVASVGRRLRGVADRSSKPLGLLSLAGYSAVRWLYGRLPGWRSHESLETSGIVTKALLRYGMLWNRATRELLVARVRHSLHLAAMLLAIGILVGMYARGVALRYEATWESTFLDAEAVNAVLGGALWPASALVRIGIPDAAGLEAPDSGPAAPWIHLYAATTGLIILLPRAALAFLERRRARRLASSIPIDLSEPYFLRLLRSIRGGAVTIEVTPYGSSPEPRERDALQALLYDSFGARARIELREPVTWGEDAPDQRTRGTDGICKVIVFTLAQTPELEVHGEFLGATKRGLGPEDSLLVIIDSSAFQRRGLGPDRLESRQRAWDRLVKDQGIEAVHVHLEGGSGDDVLTQVARSRWPGRQEMH